MAWVGDVPDLLAASPVAVAEESGTPSDAIALLQGALRALTGLQARVVIGLRLLRLRCRVDAVLVGDGAVLAFQFRMEARGFSSADRAAAEAAALDLADFHPGCAGVPVIPVLVVPAGARPSPARPLPLPGATGVVEATRLLLPAVLRDLLLLCPPQGRDPALWAPDAYRPVPSLIAAACALYARHDVAALQRAQAQQGGLAAAAAAVTEAVAAARAEGAHLAVFVTGTPGAGKTLCGLNLAFAGPGAAFLTGNPTLVHVLREALARDAISRGTQRRAARQQLDGVIQALPAFRDHYALHDTTPAERLVVVDEAQRCWGAAHAVLQTRKRPAPLWDSEPGHLLDTMGRHGGWAAVVCLVGGGQEIHDGEGGLAAWAEALARRPGWRVAAAPQVRRDADPRQRLDLPGAAWDARLHLPAPVRAVGTPEAAAWVDAVLASDAAAARSIAQAAGGVPFTVTRSLGALRRALRVHGRRAGLVASSGARRLRAEGLGAVLPHQDEDAVARWFLDEWPDVRSSDALEVVATEFAVQGLELDRVGVCWDADLVRAGNAWVARSFRASAWTTLRRSESRSNRLNAYRVLLTRARHGTVVWVPRGGAADPTRDPALYDGVAAFLHECGAPPLDDAPVPAEADPVPDPVLL